MNHLTASLCVVFSAGAWDWRSVIVAVIADAGVLFLIYTGALKAYKEANEALREKVKTLEGKYSAMQTAYAIALVNEETLTSMRKEEAQTMKCLREENDLLRRAEQHRTENP
jgi:arginine exporter protein ArgO